MGAFLFNKNNLSLFSVLSVIFLSAFTRPALAFDGVAFRKDAPIEISGESVIYDDAKKTYLAEGDVVIIQGDMTLTAEKASLDMTGGKARAEGNVVVTKSDGNYMVADSLDIDMDKETAVIVNGKLYFNDNNIYVYGAEIKKTGKETFESPAVKITSCDCENDESPAWSFSANGAKVTAEGYFTGVHSFFYIKDVPVLYSPFIVVPVKTKRQTGFLTPAFAFSRLRGTKVDNAFFWNISDSRDATFYLDIESKRGLGKGLEYRYFRTKASFGEFYFYHFKENDMDRVRSFRSDDDNLSRPLSATDDRWRLNYEHMEFLDKGVSIKADIDLVSDDEYFIDFAKDPKERSIESLESKLSVAKSWEKYNLTVQARVFDNLLLENDDGVLQRLPEALFTATSQNVPSTPIYLSLKSGFVNFVRFGGGREGAEGQRLDMMPQISLPLDAGLFDVTPSFMPRWTMYETRNDPSGGDDFRKRYIYEFETAATTSLVKFFGADFWGFEKFRHIVRPGVAYNYVPPTRQTRLPSFDEVDRIAAKNEISYSLNTTLAGKLLDGEVREDIFYMDVSQKYNLREANGDDRIDPLRKRPFSDVNAEVIFKPSARFSASSKAAYDVYDSRVENLDGAIAASDKRGDNISLSYRFLRGLTRYAEGNAILAITQKWDAGALARYSFMDDKYIEKGYFVDYKHQCWSVRVKYSERLEEKIVFFTFGLNGLGEVFSASAGLDERKK